MIIEIKGLPEGQKIKHINVDISFDDSGDIQDINTKADIGSYKQPENIPTEPVMPQNESFKEYEVQSIEKREKKEIPDEMRDIEF